MRRWLIAAVLIGITAGFTSVSLADHCSDTFDDQLSTRDRDVQLAQVQGKREEARTMIKDRCGNCHLFTMRLNVYPFELGGIYETEEEFLAASWERINLADDNPSRMPTLNSTKLTPTEKDLFRWYMENFSQE